MMKTLLPLLLGAALLLSSCTRWHLGDRLRAPYTTYTGADLAHPVDGKIHHDKGLDPEKGERSYVVAPEMTYRLRPQLTNTDSIKPVPPERVGFRPTGRTVVVEISKPAHGPAEYREVPRLPRGLVAERHDSDSPSFFPAELARREERPGWARRALIHSCDYAVDPLLNVLTVPVEGAALLTAGVLSLPVGLVCMTMPALVQQQGAVCTPPEPLHPEPAAR